MIELVIKQPEWSPRKLATAFVGQQQYCLRGVGLPTSGIPKIDPITNGRYGILPPIKLQGGGPVIRCWT